MFCGFIGFCVYQACAFPFSHTPSFVPAWYQNSFFLWIGITLGAPIFFLWTTSGVITMFLSFIWASVLFYMATRFLVRFGRRSKPVAKSPNAKGQE